MGTPSLFPYLLKSGGTGIGGAAGTVYIETFGVEVVEVVDIEVIELQPAVEVVELVVDVEILEEIEVEIPNL